MKTAVALEAITPESAAMLAAILADESVRTPLYAFLRGVSPETAANRWTARPDDSGDGVRLAARCLETRLVVGGVGITRRELSFFVARAQWGQGYGTAMVGACLERLDADVDPRTPPLVARVQRENLPSRRIIERFDFRLRGLERRPDGLPPVLRYERPAVRQ